MVFGFKTEKKSGSGNGRKRENNNDDDDDDDTKTKGRKGRDDYPGATKHHVCHPDLKAGDQCPECHKGKLKLDKPGVDYHWQGTTPIRLDIYLLERFICPNCKTTFTAPSPVADTAKTVDDSDSHEDHKVARVDRNASANTMVALLRFWYGVPHYRLEKIQGNLGIGLASGTQYQMLYQVYLAAVIIYEQLIYLAAQGSMLQTDDTSITILDWLRGLGPPGADGETKLKKGKTTAVISHAEDRSPIVLYLTSGLSAGKELQEVLTNRESDAAFLYLCDGLSANSLGKDRLYIQAFCLDHARRKFWDLIDSYPQHCEYLIELLGTVYHNDEQTKKLKMNAVERRDYHKKHSSEPMRKIGEYLQKNLDNGNFEENGELGDAANYMLDRWSGFNEFLHTPGIPISNADCERMIKAIIRHRKNSLFYKTDNGALVGDVLQSIIATCIKAGKNPAKYLDLLQENKSEVRKNPMAFLPWTVELD